MSKSSALSAAYRWSIVSRIAAATLGGYALTSAATVLLALAWPAPKAQAVLWATMLSFVIYTAAVIWAVYVRSATRAWVGMAGGAALCSALAWLLMPGAGA